MSGPVWMYRSGEARLFASPDEVPQGEGWCDSPANIATDEKKPKGKKSKSVNEDGDVSADSDTSA